MASRPQKKFNRRLAQGYSEEGLKEMHPTIAKRHFDKLKPTEVTQKMIDTLLDKAKD